MIKLVVFLGNPGREHAESRHNFGWLLADIFETIQYANWQKKFKGSYCQTTIGDETVYFLKPENYMNLSGESVQAMCHFFRIKADELLVVHDDLEMVIGEVGFKKGGGLGGHNGLRSVADKMNTRDFHRLRLGIGRPVHGSVSAHVLGKFTKDEQIVLSMLLGKTNRLLQDALPDGIAKMEKRYSKTKLIN